MRVSSYLTAKLTRRHHSSCDIQHLPIALRLAVSHITFSSSITETLSRQTASDDDQLVFSSPMPFRSFLFISASTLSFRTSSSRYRVDAIGCLVTDRSQRDRQSLSEAYPPVKPYLNLAINYISQNTFLCYVPPDATTMIKYCQPITGYMPSVQSDGKQFQNADDLSILPRTVHPTRSFLVHSLAHDRPDGYP